MTNSEVRDAYAVRAGEYIDLFGSIDAAATVDRERVLTWALGVDGRIIDVGCGPGQWTSFLAAHGVDVEGVDPVPEFVEHARREHPGVAFAIGEAERLDADDASVGGVLAWYSLIHARPDEIDAPLAEFARCVCAGGGLAIGFFEGPQLLPFDHAVTTAYFWPVALLSARVERAGFSVTDVHTRTDPGTRSQGLLLAQRQTVNARSRAPAGARDGVAWTRPQRTRKFSPHPTRVRPRAAYRRRFPPGTRAAVWNARRATPRASRRVTRTGTAA